MSPVLRLSAVKGTLVAFRQFGRGSGRRYILPLGAAAVAVSVASATLVASRTSLANAYEPSDLPEVEARVRADFPRVDQLGSASFAGRWNKPGNRATALLFDARAPEEYAVSRIPGAVRVDPDITVDGFLAFFSDRVAGREVVFYCSVGVRSSKLADRLKEKLAAAGARGTFNLEGGLFRWHNEGRNVVDAFGPTERIHPYDSFWGGLIVRQDRIATKPVRDRVRRFD